MNKNIIVVDDDEVIAYLCSCVLKDLGNNTSYYTRPLDVIEQTRKHPKFFNLIICNQTMNELSGTDLAEELYMINPNISIIILIGNKKNNIVFDKHSNIKDIIVKPVSKEVLQKSIKKIFRREM